MGRRVIDLVGSRFGRYSVIGLKRVDERRGAMWRCQCACGEERVVAGRELRRGSSKSCGCLQSELMASRKRTHGATGTRAFNVWRGMKERCGLLSHKSYAAYGGSGIRVCDRWANSFAAFLADMGDPPSTKHTLDRWPNQSGNYEPGNCRWATAPEQARNKRTNVRYPFNGQMLVIKDLSVACGVPEQTLYNRFTAGLSVEEATQKLRRVRLRQSA